MEREWPSPPRIPTYAYFLQIRTSNRFETPALTELSTLQLLSSKALEDSAAGSGCDAVPESPKEKKSADSFATTGEPTTAHPYADKNSARGNGENCTNENDDKTTDPRTSVEAVKRHHHCIELIESFRFRGHLCLTFPVFGPNLYEY